MKLQSVKIQTYFHLCKDRVNYSIQKYLAFSEYLIYDASLNLIPSLDEGHLYATMNQWHHMSRSSRSDNVQWRL